MNEALQNSLATIINSAVSSVEAGVDFLAGQLPDVVQQLLLYSVVSSIAWLVLGAVSVAAFVFAYLRYRQHDAAHTRWDTAVCSALESSQLTIARANRDLHFSAAGNWSLVAIPLGLFALVGIVTILDSLTTLLKLWLAPKVWLIQYAADLVK